MQELMTKKELPSTDLNVTNRALGTYNDSFTSERFFDATTNLSFLKVSQVQV